MALATNEKEMKMKMKMSEKLVRKGEVLYTRLEKIAGDTGLRAGGTREMAEEN